MKKILKVLFALLLTACSPSIKGHNVSTTTSGISLPADPGKSIVVVGISVRHPSAVLLGNWSQPIYMGWIAVDPQSGSRIGDVTLTSTEVCSVMTAGYDVAAGLSDACDSIQYRSFEVSPGTYTLGWLFSDGQLRAVATFEKISAQVPLNNLAELQIMRTSEKARARPGMPAFSVGPGEVIYVGDIQIDLATMHIVLGSKMAGAQQFLQKNGKDGSIAERMISRRMLPWTPPAAAAAN